MLTQNKNRKTNLINKSCKLEAQGRIEEEKGREEGEGREEEEGEGREEEEGEGREEEEGEGRGEEGRRGGGGEFRGWKENK